MPSVRITQLPVLTQISANNANTVFVAVDKTTNTTSQFSTTTLAAGLFANNILNVGTKTTSTFPGLIAQFIANTAPYGQVNYQNANSAGSMDVVLTADIGDDANNFLDLGINNSGYADPQYSSMKPADGYLMVFGKQGNDYTGNLVLGTAAAKTNVVFSVGGTTNLDVVAKMTENGLELNNGSYIKFSDGSIQSTKASAESVTLTIQANTIVTQGVDTWQNTQIVQVNQYAASGYAKANAALANATGTFAGDLTITGNTEIFKYVDVINPNFDANTPLVHITASDGGVTVPPSNSYYMLHITGKANNVARVVVDSFGANTYPLYTGRMGRGSAAAPAATANNDVLVRLTGNGYTGTQFPASSPTKIDFVATENFTDTNRGTRIEFWNTPNGSNTIQKVASFNANTVDFIGAVNPEKGFIYTPVIYPGAQTAITIDIADGPLVRAQTSTGLTVTLSNFVKGKVVELWVTNISGSTQTFTHGVSAINATNGSTTVSMPGNSTLTARYVCLDGTLANTMVAIVRG